MATLIGLVPLARAWANMGHSGRAPGGDERDQRGEDLHGHRVVGHRAGGAEVAEDESVALQGDRRGERDDQRRPGDAADLGAGVPASERELRASAAAAAGR